MQRFLSELQRRKVIRVGAGYVVGAWIVLQVALALQAAMTLSASFSAAILALLVIGFPIALGLSWFFEITPEGIKRTVVAGDGALLKPQTPDFILAAMLALVLVVALVQSVTPRDSAQAPAAPTTAAEAQKPKPPRPALGEKSIAVLPFANLSPHKDDVYFADGLTEEILNAVAQIRGIRLVSRTSTFALKGKNVPLGEIAKQLAVRYALEGSVRREGDDVRITAQLVDVPSDLHIWSKTFEPKLEHAFVVQHEIANAIALALEVEVSMPADPRGAPTRSMEAYRLYLEGQEILRRGHVGNVLDATALYERALELDANFAEAHAQLAGVYLAMPIVDATSVQQALPQARRHAETARALNPRLAGPFHVLGSLDAFDLRWDEAFANYAKAIELDPSYSYAYTGRGIALQRLGWLVAGNRSLKHARSIDPLNNQISAPLAYSAFARADDRVVATMAERIITSSNEFAPYGHWLLACLAQEKGSHDEADRHFRTLMTIRGKNKTTIEPVSRALKSRTAVAQAIRVLQEEGEKDPAFQFENLLYLIDPQDAWVDELNARLARKERYFVSFWLPAVWRVVNMTGGASPKLKQLMRDAGLVDYWRKHGWPDRCRAKGEDDFECS